MVTEDAGFLEVERRRLAWRRVSGARPTIVWFGGFKSDMTGTKAEALAAWARENGRAFLRFDYSGHGASGGRFEDFVVSDWLGDALAVIDRMAEGPLIFVGSSMGGWIATLAALQRPERLAGALFIAPAPDFTEDLMWNAMTGAERDRLLRDDRLIEQSPYSDEPTIITRSLIEDGRRHLVLGGAIGVDRPVRIIQGMADPDVPWRHALRFAECLVTDDLELTLVKAGDHRLSKTHEIRRIVELLGALCLKTAS